ncbi:hypothetical protein VTK73DRAFT_1174 [Phialemonium thermophilum]|uniref:ARS binding protein 2 n=1 Tax=Phialemonium thermophilum TaxID=223376 RepID=A0ABR3XAU3_9PEZI
MQQQPPDPALPSSSSAPSSAGDGRPLPLVRPMLPHRDVTKDTIEDAYVQFILHCNPAVPRDCDTAALREAFRNPPKSGGKTFNTFTLFQLIRQLEAKELKTWAELALKLGVEPPDQDKGQSSQKIQQYAVRLKRWMHSMHVDAFFEYLLDVANSYWTEIPSDPTPISEFGRDGVAAEDDMALRALLPHIRPRRGRRKPGQDEEVGNSPTQRPSLGGDEVDDNSAARQMGPGPWSAHPESRGRSTFVFSASDPMRLNAGAAANGLPQGLSWSGQDAVQTPATAYPHSAITPSTRQAFWADEPKSAITPSKGRLGNKRHGAKVVSSAWRSGLGGTGKTRGRPPMNRNTNDGPFSSFAVSDLPGFKVPPAIEERTAESTVSDVHVTAPPAQRGTSQASSSVLTDSAAGLGVSPATSHTTPPASVGPSTNGIPTTAADAGGGRPAKRSRLSLQVPPRVGGDVRLATPPPPSVFVNGRETGAAQNSGHLPGATTTQSAGSTNPASGVAGLCESPNVMGMGGGNVWPGYDGAAKPLPTPQQVRFDDPMDRTNVDSVEAWFMESILTADWFDARGARTPPCGVEEASCIVDAVIENLRRSASSKDNFLINLSALAGGYLLSTHVIVTRVEALSDRTKYLCTWELRYGDIRSVYSMSETVMHDKWAGKTGAEQGSTSASAFSGSRGSGDAAPAHWEKKYQEMCMLVSKKDRQLAALKRRILESLKDPPLSP